MSAASGRMAEPLEIAAAVEKLLSTETTPIAARAGACSLPPVPPTSRSTRCATSPTVRPASRATPSQPPRPRRRRRHARQRPGQSARSARRQCHQGRKRARHAARGRTRLAGGCRDLRRRGRRLARRDSAASRKSRRRPGKPTPELSLTENPDILSTIAHRKTPAAETGDRLCRRNRERRRQCQGQARAARAATGSWPTTFRRKPASWAATATRSRLCARRASNPGRRKARTRSRAG